MVLLFLNFKMHGNRKHFLFFLQQQSEKSAITEGLRDIIFERVTLFLSRFPVDYLV